MQPGRVGQRPRHHEPERSRGIGQRTHHPDDPTAQVRRRTGLHDVVVDRRDRPVEEADDRAQHQDHRQRRQERDDRHRNAERQHRGQHDGSTARILRQHCVSQRTDEPADAERHQHPAQLRRFVAIGEIFWEKYRLERHVETGRCEVDDRQCAQHLAVPDEAQALDDACPDAFGQLAAVGLAGAFEAQHRDDRDRQAECRRRHPHRVHAAQRGDQQAADARTHDVGQVEDRLVHAVGVVQCPTGSRRRLGQHRFARRHARGVEERAEGGESCEHCDVDDVRAERQREHRNRGDRNGGQRVGDHRNAFAPYVVHRGTGDQRRHQEGNRARHRNHRRVECRSGALQHQPGECDDRNTVARTGHQRGEQDDVERSALAVDHGLSPRI